MDRTMGCPTCKAQLDVSRYTPGQRIRCGACNAVVVVQEALPEAAPVPSVVAPSRGGARRPALRSRHARVSVPNLLPWSIIATLLCCQVGGIIAIVYSVQANAAAERGDLNAARRSEKAARLWLWISAMTLPAAVVLLVSSGFFTRGW